VKDFVGSGKYLDVADEALREKPRKSRHQKLPIEEIFKRATGREMTNSERLAFRIPLNKTQKSKTKPLAA
jgi:hypothetical protein